MATLRIALILALGILGNGSATADQLGGDLAGRTSLFQKLFTSYDENIIPDNVTVTLGVSLQYLDANPVKNELEVQAHITQSWVDSRLAWDNDTTGINILHVSPKKLWKPDIVLYNSADFRNMQNCQDAERAIVFYTGHVVWVVPCELRSRCNFTTSGTKENAVCGEQKCQLKFSSWIHDKELLDIEVLTEDPAINLEEFGSKTWKITETKAERHERTFSGYPNAYADVTFNMTFSQIEPDKDC